MEKDKKYLRLAIEYSRKSAGKKLFPVGALVIKDDEILSSALSSKFPASHKHAESESVDKAFEKVKDQLTDCTLYSSMEPCLMCITRAYWVGIRRVVFALSKKSTKNKYFEGKKDNESMVDEFNQPIKLIHIADLENDALKVVETWEKRGSFNQ